MNVRHAQPLSNSQARWRLRIHPRGGFTIIELLVAVAIIILLLSILIVAVSGATRVSQRTRTQFLMASIKKGMVRFREDIGYYPPILGAKPPVAGPQEYRRLFDWRGANRVSDAYSGDDIHPANGNYKDLVQFWNSMTSPAEYLIGWGSHIDDGYGKVPGAAALMDWDQETPPVGIRPPGPDGVWGADAGLPNTRMRNGGVYGAEAAPFPFDQGRVFGPYLELKDDRLLAAISGTDANGNPQIVFAGDPLPAGVTFDTLPKVIVDYWGTPIRYYRRPYPPGGLTQSYRAGVDINQDGNLYNDRVPTLSDFFVLRPYSITDSGATDGLPDKNADTSTTSQLDSAEFALFSLGPDRSADFTVRNDSGKDGDGDLRLGENEDNIVEVGP